LICDSKTFQLLGEKLYHITALKLTMHQNIEPKRLLKANDFGYLFSDAGIVLGFGDFAFAKGFTQGTQVFGLGERPDRRSRQWRQLEALPL
jgi:hypothetical protein